MLFPKLEMARAIHSAKEVVVRDVTDVAQKSQDDGRQRREPLHASEGGGTNDVVGGEKALGVSLEIQNIGRDDGSVQFGISTIPDESTVCSGWETADPSTLVEQDVKEWESLGFIARKTEIERCDQQGGCRRSVCLHVARSPPHVGL